MFLTFCGSPTSSSSSMEMSDSWSDVGLVALKEDWFVRRWTGRSDVGLVRMTGLSDVVPMEDWSLWRRTGLSDVGQVALTEDWSLWCWTGWSGSFYLQTGTDMIGSKRTNVFTRWPVDFIAPRGGSRVLRADGADLLVSVISQAGHVDNNSCLVLRLRKVWQKRKCSVKNGFLTICHGTVRRDIFLCYWSTCMGSSALLPACSSSNKKGFIFDFNWGNTTSDFSFFI